VAGQGVGAAQGVGYPVRAGHLPDEVGGVSAGHPGGGDVERAGRGPAPDRDGVGGGAEGGLGHADHRDAELGAGAGAQPGPSVRVQVSVAVDDEQGHLVQAIQGGTQRRELAPPELAWLVGLDVGYQSDALGGQAREGGIGGYDGAQAPPEAR
jgi:hypothetical protein